MRSTHLKLLFVGLLVLSPVLGCGSSESTTPDSSAVQGYVNENAEAVAAQEKAEALRENAEAEEDEDE